MSFPAPCPRETLARLLDLDLPTHFIHGNGELAILAQMAGARDGSVTYWGTTSGARPPESIIDAYCWTAAQLQPEFEPVLADWPKTVQLEIDGLGQVLFCHSTPRSETEVFTRLTSEDRLLSIFEATQRSRSRLRSHAHAVRSNDRKNSSSERWQRRDAVWRIRCVLAVTWTRRSASPYALRSGERCRKHSRQQLSASPGFCSP